MYKNDLKDLEYALQFTQVYQGQLDKALREAKCLEIQIPYILNPIREDDLIVGTMIHGYVGFSPQYGGEHAYYFHDFMVASALDKLRAQGRVSDDFVNQVEDMRQFWATENTPARVAVRFKETWGDWLPGTFYDAGCRIAGVNVDMETLINLGLGGLKTKINTYRKRNGESTFYDALDMSVDTIATACQLYAAQAREQAVTAAPARQNELLEISQIFDNITTAPPKTFKEGLQLFWIYAVCSSLMNYGRMDNYLGDLYAQDLDNGSLTEDEAIRWLSSLYRNIITVRKIHDSRLIFGGYGRKKPANADRLAIALIKTSRIVKDTIPQLTMRYYSGMDERLMDETLINIQEGATYPIIYSDETTIPSIQGIYGVDHAMASNWVPLGCGEYTLEGYGIASPNSGIYLPNALNLVLHSGVNSFTGKLEIPDMPDSSTYETFEDLFAAYDRLLRPVCELVAHHEQVNCDVAAEQACYLHHSLLLNDCIEKGLPMLDGGVRYLAATNESFGFATCADSLMAIKHCVYDKKYFTLPQLTTMLKANFEGYETQRKLLQNAPKYGNDNDEADQMAVRVFNHMATLIEDGGRKTNLHAYRICFVNNSASADRGAIEGATACGRLSTQPFSNGCAPSLGADKNGLTAALNSMAKIDAKRHVGVVHNIRFDKDMFIANRDAVKSVLKAFFENNGAQVNLSTVGKDDLQNALKNPEAYKDLIVRIGGFSARFVELSEIIQKEIIARTTYEAV